MRVQLYGEGCLDSALGSFILESLDIRINSVSTGGGWRNTVDQVVATLESSMIEAGTSSFVPSHIVAFVDADNDVYNRIFEIRKFVEDRIESRVRIEEVSPGSTSLQYPLGLGIKLHDSSSKALIVLWATDRGSHAGGTVEDVLGQMLAEAYECRLGSEYASLKAVFECSECPNRIHQVYSHLGKHLVVAALAACVGEGTLVASLGSGTRYCGVNVVRLLSRMERIKNTRIFRAYTSLVKDYLGL